METKKHDVTFHVFRKDGSKNPDIKLFFLENMVIDAHTATSETLKLQDGTVWSLILEQQVKEALKRETEVACLVSFQARTYGNYAVARLFDKDKRKQKERQ